MSETSSVVRAEDIAKLDIRAGRVVGVQPFPEGRPDEIYECDFPV